MDVLMIVQELFFDGCVSLGRCSKSTVYRYQRAVNEYLENDKSDWRVKADYKSCCLYVI